MLDGGRLVLLARSIARFDEGLFGGLLALMMLAAPARADLPREVSIRWSGDCPRPFGLEAEVSQLLGGKRPQLAPTEFELEVDEDDGAFELSLEVDSDAAHAKRKVKLASCQEAQDAAVLLVATAIDPDAVLRVRPPPPPPPPPPPEAPRQKVPPYRWSLVLGGLFDLQSLPAAIAGPSLGGLWQDEHWRVRLDVRYLPGQTAERRDPDVRADVDLFTTGLGGARVWALGPLVLGPALEVEAGAIRSRDIRGQVVGQNDRAPWGCALFGATAAYRATARFGLELGVFAGVPLTRPELSIRDGRSFYTTAPVTMRLALAARVSLGSP